MAPITQPEVRELATWQGREAMTSCYLDVDGRRFVRQQDLDREAELLVKRARGRMNGNRSVHADLDRILAYVRRGVDRTSNTRSLAIFTCTAEDYWRVVPMPATVTSQVIVGTSPAVAPLEAALQDHERLAVLLVDRQRARLVVVGWGGVEDEVELAVEAPAWQPGDHAGTRDRPVRSGTRETDGNVARQAAKAVWELHERVPFDRLALAGPDEVVAELERALHPYLVQRCCGRVAVAVGAPTDEVQRAARILAVEVERRREAEVVQRLRDLAAAGGRAVTGLDATLAAVGAQRVERLVVSHGFSESGWRCESCGCLARLGRTCAGCASEMVEVEDIVSEAIDCALQSGARVDLCVGDADLDVLGRIGALLRF